MLCTLVVVAGLFNYIFAAPLSSCEAQADCIDVSITDQEDTDSDGNALYEICLIFDATLDDCVKDESDSISHACVAGSDGLVSSEDGEKVEGLDTGDDAALCDIIPCGTVTTFGLKDGSSCELDGEFLYANLSIPDYDQYVYCYSGMSCNANGKNSKACKWAVFAPDCEAQCPETEPSVGDACDFEGKCEYGEVECCGETMATTSCECDDNGMTQCAVIDCTPDSLCPTEDEPCVCMYDGEDYVTPEACANRCSGGCALLGEGMCGLSDPPASAMIYSRTRMDNDLVSNGDETDDTSEKTSNAGIMNLAIVNLFVAISYLFV